MEMVERILELAFSCFRENASVLEYSGAIKFLRWLGQTMNLSLKEELAVPGAMVISDLELLSIVLDLQPSMNTAAGGPCLIAMVELHG